MSNSIQIFNFESTQVRTIIRDGEPWFVASDICRILEISNNTDALKRIDEDDRTLVLIEGASNGLPVNAVNESGLYALILGSRKPDAKRFKKWVTSEVLPTIRKTGSYAVPQFEIPKTLSSALYLAARQAETIEGQEKILAAQAPLIEGYNTFLGAKNCQTMAEVAKMIGTGRNRLFERLRAAKLLMNNNLPYQQFVDRGYFEVHNVSIKRGDEVIVKTQTLVTPRGMDYIKRHVYQNLGAVEVA
jgi:anti-repressor protein